MANLDTSGLQQAQQQDTGMSHRKLVRNLIIGAAVVVGAAVVIWLLIQRGQAQQASTSATNAGSSSGGTAGKSNPPSPDMMPASPPSPVPGPIVPSPTGIPVFRPMPAEPGPTGGPQRLPPAQLPPTGGPQRLPPAQLPPTGGPQRLPPAERPPVGEPGRLPPAMQPPVAPEGSHGLPEMPASHEPPATHPAERTVVVAKYPEEGSTLTGISTKVYGTPSRWAEIYAANRGVIGSNPNQITPGTVLTIPA